MAAREHGHERLLDYPLLAENHLADRGLGGGDLGAGRFRLTHDHVVELLNHFSAGYRHLCAPVGRGLLLGFLRSRWLLAMPSCGAPSSLSVPADQTSCNIRATARKRGPGRSPPSIGCLVD